MAIWFMRFSAAICLATVVGTLGVAWQAWRRAAAEESAVAAAHQHVEQLGGSLLLEERTYVVMLPGREITDEQLEQLVVVLHPIRLDPVQAPDGQRLFAFNLAGTKVGDRGVQAISTLRLNWLNLNGTRVTNGALPHLRDQQRLGVMTVAGTRVTRPAIKEIQVSLPHLWVPALDSGL